MANLKSLTVSGSLSVSGQFQLPDLRVDKSAIPYDTPNTMYWSVGGRSHDPSLLFNQTGSWAPVWSTGTSTTQFAQCGMAVGTVNHTLYITGCTPSGVCLCTEEWNGTSWTARNVRYGNRYYGAMTGTADNAITFGWCACSNTGCINNQMEEWDGLTWMCGSSTNHVHVCHDASGITNAALAFGGYCCNVPSANCAFCRTEEYNGSTWAVGPNMNCSRTRAKGTGTVNATVVTGGCCVAECANCCCFCSSPGQQVPFQCDTEEYNGTAWSKTAYTTYGMDCGHGVTGTANDAWAFGGCCCNTSHYDGIGWNLSTNNPTNTGFHGSAGDSNGSLQIGGVTHKCEVYQMDLPLKYVEQSVCGATWTAGPIHKCCFKEEGFELGTQTAASYVGGCCCRFSDEWNGIQWELGGYNGYLTSQACARWGVGWGCPDGAYMTAGLCGCSKLLYVDGISMSCVRSNSGLSGSFAGGTALGQIDSALIVGDTCFASDSVEMSYITFGECAPYNSCHCHGTGLGTVDGAYVIGGTGSLSAPNAGNCVEYYNGTSWSAGNNITNPRYKAAATGTVNSGIVIGGISSCYCTEYWDGTTWSADTSVLYRKDNRPGMVGENACGYAFGGNECGCACTEFRVGFDNCNYHWCCAQENCQKGYICMGVGAWQTGPSLPTAMYCPNGAGHGFALTVWEGGYCCATQAYNGVSWAQESISPCCGLYGGFSSGSPYDTLTIPGRTPSCQTGTNSTLLYDGTSYYTCGGNHPTCCSVGSGGSTVAVQYPGGCCCRIACWAGSTWRWCHILYPAPAGCCLPQESATGGDYYAGFHIGCGGQAWCIRGGYSALPNFSRPVVFGAGVGNGKFEMGWYNGCRLCAYDGISNWNAGGTPGCRRGAAGGGRYIEEAWSAGGPYVGGSTFQFKECCQMVFSRSGSADTKFVCNVSSILQGSTGDTFYDPCQQ